VERCLNSFDNVHEWADCIAFLKQLLKVCDFDSLKDFLLKYCEPDLSIIHAIQGDSKEAHSIETTSAMSESCVTDGSTSESFGCIFTHSGCTRGKCNLCHPSSGKDVIGNILVRRLEARFTTLVVRSFPIF
jgi:hypothetical protein